MPHRGVLASATHLNHCRVIVMDDQDNVPLKQHIPQVHCWDAHRTETIIRGHDLGLGRAMRHRRLLARRSLQREEGVWTSDAEEDAARAPTRSLATSEVGVGVQVDAHVTRGIAHPTNTSKVEGSLHIAHETMQHLVTMCIPASDEASQAADRLKKVVTADPRNVQKFHQHSRGHVGKLRGFTV
jgi:hypothetical protein